ncbi:MULTISPECIES: hypothetical protein [unclassified Nocardioides]|uniref:hypothetical protein n=1 Tax=unclassified Nocardioides TaxID=2615069 RepID=UPI0012E3699C|nr:MULTISPECIES: hypothetical protein [unclassified Nocardioides]
MLMTARSPGAPLLNERGMLPVLDQKAHRFDQLRTVTGATSAAPPEPWTSQIRRVDHGRWHGGTTDPQQAGALTRTLYSAPFPEDS